MLFSIENTANASLFGEIYSETTYVPAYGLLSENYLRFYVQGPKLYLGLSTQSQHTTKDDQTDLYEKNRVMPLVGSKGQLWKHLHYLIELRTEDRSRLGLFAGNIWEYSLINKNIFTEYYAEGIILPSFSNEPIFSAWIKQGLRFKPATSFFLDPYLELYGRVSPDPDLGRDTKQIRAGLRGIYFINNWSLSLLTYQSFAEDEKDHVEALFVIGGTF